MSTLAVTHALTSIFVPIGFAGVIIALICALIVAFALARRAAGLAGGAAGVWIVGALLSSASSFADMWLPLFVSLGALGAALVTGILMRVLVRSVAAVREHAPQESDLLAQDSRSQTSPVTVVRARPSSPVTDGFRAVA